MRITNSHNQYGLIAQTLHWLVAILILAAYLAVFYHEEFTQKHTPEHLTSIQWHLAIGLSIGCFVILRILARLMMTQPEPVSRERKDQLISHSVHGLLYFFMLAMPISGYLSAGIDSKLFGLIPVTAFKDTQVWSWFSESFSLQWETFEETVEGFHHFVGESVLWVLIAIHIAAALYHQFVRKDNIIARMTPVSKDH